MGIPISKLWNENADGMPIHVDPNNPLVREIAIAKEKMTGWDRIKMIFERDDLGDATPELIRIRDGTFMGFFVGGIIGAMGRSKIAYMDFFRSNYHEAFETPLKAKSALQQKVTMGMMSGGFRVGWRIGAFTGMYLLTSSCITAYRDKMGILDQVGGGAAAGFLYKFREGPKSMVVGTGLGAALGLVAGSLTIGLIKLTGQEPDKANIWYYENVERRKRRQQDIYKKTRAKNYGENDESLLMFHEKFMKPETSLDTIQDKEQNLEISQKTPQSENESKENTTATSTETDKTNNVEKSPSKGNTTATSTEMDKSDKTYSVEKPPSTEKTTATSTSNVISSYSPNPIVVASKNSS